MSGENTFIILERNGLSCSGLNYELYEEFSKVLKNEKDVVQKIIEYNHYEKSNNNKYSDKIMQILRQIHELNKFDFSEDKELNELLSNEVFKYVVEWNGLLGQYSETIKGWVSEIYGVDLNKIK